MARIDSLMARIDADLFIAMLREHRPVYRSGIIDREAFNAHGGNDMWLAWIAAQYEQRSLEESYQDGDVNAEAVHTAWAAQHRQCEQWYRPYLYDHQERRMAFFKGRRLESVSVPGGVL